jgi:hypothetical protein
MYIGSWKVGDLITFYANTHNASNGSAQDADAVPTYRVYEDETTTPILNGSMALIDSANTVGFYSEQITASSGNGFEKGKSYSVYIQAVVSNVTGTTHRYFQIEAEVDSNSVSVPVTAGSVTGSVAGSVGSVTSPVTVGTNNDKTGYSLSSPQSVHIIGNITGTITTVLNVVNHVNVSGSSVRSAVGMASANLDTQLTNIASDASSASSGISLARDVLEAFGTQPATVGNTGNDATHVHLDGLTYADDEINDYLLIVLHSGKYYARWIDDWVLSTELATVATLPFTPSTSNSYWLVYTLRETSSPGSDPWTTVLPGAYGVGTAGHILASRMPTGTVLVGDKTGFSLSTPQAFNLIGNISGTITNVNNVVNPVTVGANNDKTGYGLTNNQVVNFSGTITNVVNVINPVVAGVVTGSVLGNVNGSVNSVTNPVGLSTGTLLSAIADQVWDEALAGHLTAGSAGNALNGAGSAGDPWSTSLPGSYTTGQAGHILSSRMPTGTVLVGDKTGFSLSSPQNINIVGNISGTWVGNIQGSVASVTDLGSTLLNKIADFILRRPLASARSSSDGDAVTFRSLLGATSKLVNRWKISGTTLTVYEENDTTAAGTQALTGTSGADPITEVDTNG